MSSNTNPINEIDSDLDEPPPKSHLGLDDLILVLDGMEDTEDIHKKGHIHVEKMSDDTIEISFRPIISKKGWYMAFKIYSDGHFADNSGFIKRTGGMNTYYETVKAKIGELGLGPCHTNFIEYQEVRWDQYARENNFHPYNLE